MSRILRRHVKRYSLSHQIEAMLMAWAAEGMHTLLRYWPAKKTLQMVVFHAGLASLTGSSIGLVIRLLFL